jgi:hypothetical protein
MLTLNTTGCLTGTLTSTVYLAILIGELLDKLLDLALLLGCKTVDGSGCFFWFWAWLQRWGRRAWDDVKLLQALCIVILLVNYFLAKREIEIPWLRYMNLKIAMG